MHKSSSVSRALLVKIKRDIENQIRGLLKNLGLVIGRAKMNVFAVRAAQLAESRPASGSERPCRDAGVGEIALGFAMLKRAKRASHIDPPASSYAIMRRARPYRGENPAPGKDAHGGLTPRPELENVPAGTLALVRSLLVLRCSREQNALHTLIHQRHLTPSCGGHAPTAERTLHPARMLTEA